MTTKTNDMPDQLSRSSIPRDQHGLPMAAGEQYAINGKRCIAFEDPDDGVLYLQHCFPLGIALPNSRPQSVYDLPATGLRIVHLDAEPEVSS